MINLVLHGVGKPERPLAPEEACVWLSQDTFEGILDELCQLNDFSLSIDDGNYSDVEVVVPALLQKGMKATFFIPAGKLGQRGYLGRKDVQSMAQEGWDTWDASYRLADAERPRTGCRDKPISRNLGGYHGATGTKSCMPIWLL